MVWIIHIFALIHAAVALVCRLAGISDELLLTVLTMAMSLIICMKKGLKVEFTAAIIIIANILGFMLGTLGADVLQSFISSEYLVHCISTVITTEILGWCIMGMTKLFGQKKEDDKQIYKSSPYIRWLLLIISVIFLFRILIVVVLPKSQFEEEALFEMIRRVMTNSFAMVILTCVNILFIRSLKTRSESENRFSTVALYMTFNLLATLLATFLVGSAGEKFILPFTAALVVQIALHCIVYIVNYALTVRNEMMAEREKANMAQYRYLKLKRQVNPHFLFNSLNVLDYIICEEKSEQASLYTHKLASIYRYMIKSEEEDLVTLRDEMVFVQLYIDLLKVRFQEGFDVSIDIKEEDMARFVPPCSIQLLIENATKHNAVSMEKPLMIKVESDGNNVKVSNNILPKVTKSPSTGLGQKYIRQLYVDLSGKNIEIEQTDIEYCVTLPLL